MLRREAALAMFIERDGMSICMEGVMALFAEHGEGVPAAFGRLRQRMYIAVP